MKRTKTKFLHSLIALLACFSLLIGSTFAWFTDSVSSMNNIITSGNLDLEMYWTDDLNGTWYNVEDAAHNTVFSYDNWEPGYTDVKYIKLVNVGELALNYKLAITPQGGVGKLADVINVYFANEGVEMNDRTDLNKLGAVGLLSYVMDGNVTAGGTLLAANQQSPLHPSGEIVLTVAMNMLTSAGNEYQNETAGNFTITALATQAPFEKDSFGSDYDEDAEFPAILPSTSVSAPVTPVDGKVPAGGVTMTDGVVSATLPEGVKLADGVDKVTLKVTPLESSSTDITVVNQEILIPVDVHIDGVAEDNTVPIVIELGPIMPKYLNIGNYALIHVEDGVNNAMTRVNSKADLTAHNQFTYDLNTGAVTVCMASFSEVAALADISFAWQGGVDHSWYDANKTELTISNADQLWSLSQIVGGMADGIEQDSFSGKTVKLISDINLGDDEENNNAGVIFYPIGYYNSEGTYTKNPNVTEYITSGFYTFEGVFDGNGNTISNFYQNSWEMMGDHEWYTPAEQYYRDGMGLFGRVYKGTIKNLTVDNFSSDGEITTTGVIAAYADGATFENITITNCNPRVYNIGNGGIVGCAGWYAKEAGLKTTFTNITVDQTNKISALWGTYDVSCGGILGQYYPQSGQTSAGKPANAGIHFENCHVAAIMDVHNDVCANYQYYWYRYSGTFIGTVRANTKDANGYTVADTTGITATDCSYTLGDWNQYWYCELVKNSLASYTHDHQFSRLTTIRSLSEIQDESGNWDTEGNFVIPNADNTAATCYHIFRNSEGNLYQHFHDVADESNPNIYETKDINGDGQLNDLKEDRTCYFMPFNQVMNGLGYGVKAHFAFEGIEDKTETGGKFESVEKFKAKNSKDDFGTGEKVAIGDLFEAIVDESIISSPSVQVHVSPVGYGSTAQATYSGNSADWENGTLTFSGAGSAKIVITDYFYCKNTVLYVSVGGVVTAYNKFESKFTGDFLYRVGNANTVSLGSLFKLASGASVSNVSVSVETVNGASGVYTPNATWTNGTIQFSGTGVVKVTITDENYCTPTVLYLEVVDATNVTGLSGAISGSVVLLNDCGISSLTISGRNTVYGNGFTATYTGNGQYLNNGLRQGIVSVSEDGTLDNLHIKASIYPNTYMYYGTTTLGEYVQSGPYTTEGDKTRYHYQLSAVAAKGNATISNCYIYGGRNNVFVDTGDVTIKDTVLECGVVANVQIQSTDEYTVTLEDVTTIQYQVNPTVGETSLVMLGAGVIVGPDTQTNPKIVLNGQFKQYNWVTAEDKTAVSKETAQMIIGGALDATAFNHMVNGKTASNLGIIYMNTASAPVENNTGLPYAFGNVTLSYKGIEADGQAYSLQKAMTNQIYSDYANANRSTVNGDYLPTFDFDLGDQEISNDGDGDTRYLYGDKNGVMALYQDGEDALTLDLSKLATIYKYSNSNYIVTASCLDASGNALSVTNNVVTLDAKGSYKLIFKVQDNLFYDRNGAKVDKSVERTFTVPLTLDVKAADIKDAVINITKTELDGVYNTVNLTDYELRINFLDCISVTDYDNKGTGTTVNLSSNISSAMLSPSGVNVFTTASTITITYTDGRVLTVNLSKISGSSPGTKTAKVNTSGDVYFTTEGALNNKPTEASSQNKCTITSVSYKGNSNSTVTDDTDVTVTWALESSSSGGCFTGDTLITLADGTQKRVDQLTYQDQLLVWDFYKGEYTVSVPSAIYNYGDAEYMVTNLHFSDGTTVKMLIEHEFFDAEANSFVYITQDNVADFVGHKFVKADGAGYKTVTLDSFSYTKEYTGCYTVLTAVHYNCIAEGMFSLTSDPSTKCETFFRIFEVGEGMKFDEQKMQADIEKYGLYTYDDYAAYVSYEEYVAFGGSYFKILVEKGLLTFEDILLAVATYAP